MTQYVYAYTTLNGQRPTLERLEVVEWTSEEDFTYRYFEAPRWRTGTGTINNDWYFRSEAEAVASAYQYLQEAIAEAEADIRRAQSVLAGHNEYMRPTIEEYTLAMPRNFI